MPLEKVKELGKWPFCLESLTPTIPKELLSLVIGGISEYMKAPVVLMECKPCLTPPHKYTPNFIFPERMSRGGKRESLRTYRYPEFCKAFRESFPEAEESCAKDSACRGHSIIKNSSSASPKKRCHLGLNVCMECISYLGQNLAVCTSGKFIQKGEENKVIERLQKFSHVIPDDKMRELEDLINQKDCKRELATFQKRFKKEVAHLSEMVQNYFDTVREQNEWLCREQITQALYGLPNKPDDFSLKLEEVLHILRTALSVEYLALFFADASGDRVLPLTAQAGMPQNKISSLHFNWRKAGIPHREKFKLQEWLDNNCRTSNFPNNFISNGVKGKGKELLNHASYIIPYGREFRGVLIIGPWKESLTRQATSRSKDFIQSIGHLLVANALSKRAMAASLQHDRRRDFIVAMTAHAIKHSLHTFWNSLARVKHYSTKGIELPEVISSCERMEEIIRTISKNVDMSMSAPGTAVLPNLSKYEMEIETINLATLLYNCSAALEQRAIDKKISIVINENIDSLPLIKGDRYMLQLMFSNIIDNAIKYSRVGKEVRIFSENNNRSFVSITVEDFGWGIPKEDINKIFEANYRNPHVASKKTQSRGIGLGLFQALQFAHLHEGEISASSTSGFGENHLVRFIVHLPTI